MNTIPAWAEWADPPPPVPAFALPGESEGDAQGVERRAEGLQGIVGLGRVHEDPGGLGGAQRRVQPIGPQRRADFDGLLRGLGILRIGLRPEGEDGDVPVRSNRIIDFEGFHFLHPR